MSHARAAEKEAERQEAEPKREREKSQNIIRQNPKIYWRSLKTDFSVVELDDSINSFSPSRSPPALIAKHS